MNPQEADAKPLASPARAEGVPFTQVPDHELLRQIGTGSYGEVWLARNAIGSYRAVKIVHRKRFAHERPFEREFSGIQKFEPISRSQEGLVHVLQVGRNNDAGYFYYVMELADDAEAKRSDGVVEHWSNENHRPTQHSNTPTLQHPDSYIPRTLAYDLSKRGRLPFDECLRIGLALTSALAHLHKNGLVHRDIKPSNIIFVNGAPKLADIGLVTEAADAPSYVGTEGFIPPEGPGTLQADIYSLGKVLYEIATGKDRHDYPELPTKLDETVNQAELIELNEIILTACRADPRQRYSSAEQMHADLVLLQGGRSIKQLHKLEKRLALATRVGIAAAVAALLAVGGYVGSVKQIQRARHAERESAANAAKAQTEAAKSREVAQVFKEMLNGVGSAVALGDDTKLMRRILDKSAEHIGKDLGGEPEVEAELRSTIGKVYQDLGLYEQAAVMHGAAVAIRRSLPGNDNHELTDSLNNFADTLREAGKLAEAETNATEAVAISRRIGDNEHLASCLDTLATVFSDQGRIRDAVEIYRQVLDMRKSAPGTKAEALAACLNNLAMALREQKELAEAEKLLHQVLDLLPAEHPHTAATLNNLAAVVQDQGRLPEAEKLIRQALDMTRKLQGEKHPDYALWLNTLAKNVIDQGRFAEAEDLFRQALEKMRKSLPPKHPQIATALNNVAFALWRQEKPAQAEPIYQEALAMQIELLSENHHSVALSQANLANVLRDLGRLSEAEGLQREALGKYRREFGDEHPSVAKSLGNLTDVLMREHKYDEAVKLCSEFVPPELASRPQRSGFFLARADLHARRARWKEAAADVAKATGITYGHTPTLLRLADGDQDGARQSCQRTLERFMEKTNDANTTVRMAMGCLIIPPAGIELEAAARLADSAVATDSTNVFYHFCKGLAEYRQGHFAGAVDWMAKPLESHGHSWDDSLHLEADLILAMAYWQLKRPPEAKAALDSALKLAETTLPTAASGDLGANWRDWIIAHALMREAKALIAESR